MRVLSVRNVTKKVLLVALILSVTSCGSYKLRKKPIVIDKISGFPKLHKRSDAFYNCIKGLNREGIRQSYLKDLCIATFDAMD